MARIGVSFIGIGIKISWFKGADNQPINDPAKIAPPDKNNVGLRIFISELLIKCDG